MKGRKRVVIVGEEVLCRKVRVHQQVCVCVCILESYGLKRGRGTDRVG